MISALFLAGIVAPDRAHAASALVMAIVVALGALAVCLLKWGA